jgi:putative hydrolase of the HAD superfamily
VRARAVLLDALGTLVRLEPPAPRLQTELRQRFGLAVSQAQACRAIGAEIAYYRAHLHEGRDQRHLEALRRRCARVLWHELPGTGGGEEPDVEAVVEALLASLKFTAFDEVSHVLGELRQLGIRLVVVSNWDVSLPGVLRELGLTRCLDGVVTSAGAGVRKPEPEIFERALALVEVGPEEALHVGDSPEEDVAGARAAGIRAVLVLRGDGPGREGDRSLPTISTLRELPGLLSW